MFFNNRKTFPSSFVSKHDPTVKAKEAYKYEHGYFEPISSGREFQFFSAHFSSMCRMSIRVGVFDRYTLPIHGKNMEKKIYGH